MKRKLTNRDWADLARHCGMRLEYDGECAALPLIFAMTRLERFYGSINPVQIDGEHLIDLLYLGAAALESR